MSDYSAKQLLNAWHKDLRDNQEDRYKYKDREEHIEKLIKMFVIAKVEYDEAAAQKRKVQEILVTKEGMKGKGKYKGWADNVAKDFDLMLDQYYVNVDISNVKPLEDREKAPEWMFASDPDDRIKNWVTKKYGFSEILYTEALRVGSVFNLKYWADIDLKYKERTI